MGEDDNVVVQNMSISGDVSDRADEKGDGSDEDEEVVLRRAKVTNDTSSTEVAPFVAGTRYLNYEYRFCFLSVLMKSNEMKSNEI